MVIADHRRSPSLNFACRLNAMETPGPEDLHRIDQLAEQFERELKSVGYQRIDIREFVRKHSGSSDVAEEKRAQFTGKLLAEVVKVAGEYLALVGDKVNALRLGKEFPELAWHETTDAGSERSPSRDFLVFNKDHCIQCGAPLEPGAASGGWCSCVECGDLTVVVTSAARDLGATRAQGGENDAIEERLRISLPSRFLVTGVLGQGAFGTVFRAHDNVLVRDVAIKFPNRQLVDLDLFLREARTASHLKHTNIVRIIDFGKSSGQSYIVSELIEGATLRNWIHEDRRDLKAKCQMMIGICEGVRHAHEHQVIHRDIKPGNIMVNRQSVPHLLDFGLSHSRTMRPDDAINEGQPIGTPAYMAPEQVTGDVESINERTDIYCCGVLFYQMLTLQLPFTGSEPKIFEAIRSEPPAPPRQHDKAIPLALERIVLKMIEKNPADRYQSIGKVLDDLKSFLDGRKTSLERFPDARVTGSFLRRHAGALVALLLGAALIGFAVWASNRESAASVVTRVVLDTIPPGGELLWTLVDPAALGTGSPDPVSTSGGATTPLVAGLYRVTARSHGKSLEVFRTVPDRDESGVVTRFGVPCKHCQWTLEKGIAWLEPVDLTPVSTSAEGMVTIDGGRAIMGVTDGASLPAFFSRREVSIELFQIDANEVTTRDVLRVFPNAQIAAVNGEAAARAVSWDVATAYAEAIGKNLPTIWEVAWVATDGGQTKFPWGNQRWSGDDPDMDQTNGAPAVRHLVTGVDEWSESPLSTFRQGELIVPGNNQRMAVLRSLEHVDPERRADCPTAMHLLEFHSIDHPAENLGFRCVRRAAH